MSTPNTLTATTLTALIKQARAAGWTVSRDRQTTDLKRGDARFVIFHASDPARFDHGYRLDSHGNFGHAYSTLRRFVARMNEEN